MNTLDQILIEGTPLEEIPTDKLIEAVSDKDIPHAFFTMLTEEYKRRLKMGDGKMRVESDLTALKRATSTVETVWKKLVKPEYPARYHGVSISDEVLVITLIDEKTETPVQYQHSLTDLEKYL